MVRRRYWRSETSLQCLIFSAVARFARKNQNEKIAIKIPHRPKKKVLSWEHRKWISGFVNPSTPNIPPYLIEALNKYEMPIPEFYRSMLGITEWTAGMPLYYQRLPEEVKDIPTEQSEQMQQLIAQYS